MFTIKALFVLSCHPASSVSCDAAWPDVDEAGPKVMLLQTEFLVENIETEDVESLDVAVDVLPRWDAWQSRFPELATGGNAPSNKDKVRAWTALGDEWWMEWIDGKNHSGGKHVFDHTTESESYSMPDGEFLQHISVEYKRWSDTAVWGKRWTADSVALLNYRLRGSNCTDPDLHLPYNPNGTRSCASKLYSSYYPRRNGDYYQQTRNDFRSSFAPESIVEKKRLLEATFSEYYTAIDTMPPSTASSTRVRHGFPHLAKLFTTLSELHPFIDANSRTRLFVLQTELVQLGGHPAMMTSLKDAYWCAGNVNGVADLLLAGWCDWEVVARSHKSPFLLRDFNGSEGEYHCSRPAYTYNVTSDTCVQ